VAYGADADQTLLEASARSKVGVNDHELCSTDTTQLDTARSPLNFDSTQLRRFKNALEAAIDIGFAIG